MNNCQYCYLPLQSDENDFHPACSLKMFGQDQIPQLDLDWEQVQEMANELVLRSTAVTGVQPKLSLDLSKTKNGKKRFTLVGVSGDYILKLPTSEYPELPENEDLTMHLAHAVGIQTASHSLIRLNSGELAYITKRFDREADRKLAMEDLCQLSEKLTQDKYKGSLERVGKIVFKYTANKGVDLQRLFQVALFSYLTGNADMHLKNYALLENQNQEFELSPAYDLLNTKIVIPEDNEESALNINGKKNKLTRLDFDELAANYMIESNTLNTIYNLFYQSYESWQSIIDRSFLSEEMKERYVDFLTQKKNQFYK